MRLAGAQVGLSIAADCGVQSPFIRAMGGRCLHCATCVIASQYATSIIVNRCWSGFPCKWRYINVETFNLLTFSTGYVELPAMNCKSATNHNRTATVAALPKPTGAGAHARYYPAADCINQDVRKLSQECGKVSQKSTSLEKKQQKCQKQHDYDFLVLLNAYWIFFRSLRNEPSYWVHV